MKTNDELPDELRKGNMEGLGLLFCKLSSNFVSNIIKTRMVVIKVLLAHRVKGAFMIASQGHTLSQYMRGSLIKVNSKGTLPEAQYREPH
jgi:hypothetical protein